MKNILSFVAFVTCTFLMLVADILFCYLVIIWFLVSFSFTEASWFHPLQVFGAVILLPLTHYLHFFKNSHYWKPEIKEHKVDMHQE